ncbi:MAG: hypothetical protein COV44_09485 [Deltaproteobacteria bacterium CG11_big_fil_rev_8_21_14_0_20_45_16]|nr:MAG: hypothetical protein COV44_09485 [Deltaproteobacteria bacterium CG11_big_fil_rev_8_21_14_0_20_45_16]
MNQDQRSRYIVLSLSYFSEGIDGESLEILKDLWLFSRQSFKTGTSDSKSILMEFFTKLRWQNSSGSISDVNAMKRHTLCQGIETALGRDFFVNFNEGGLCVEN